MVAAALLVLALVIAWAVADELQTSRRQAAWLSGRAAALHYEVKPGPSPAIRFPGNGPFDKRYGYHQLPDLVEQLKRQDYAVVEQARMSPQMIELIDQGLFAIYREKTQAGLALNDCRGQPMLAASTPERRYAGFEAVPRLLVDVLLFIENRELLDPDAPQRNPAIDWARFGKAAADQLWRHVDDSHAAGGGSTLATQIEKFRHSPEGRTETAR
ncbi:MAG TPA: transglycosylase domain-containing protein [Burkholderiaceae bacterium]|nr:transglycosylase domain-containing protein [Burkholderiaceae bacterium]